MHTIQSATAITLLILGAAACGGSQQPVRGPVTPDGQVVEYPPWVQKGSGAFGGEERVFYGVGSSTGINNPSLARSTADNRARLEISKIFDTYTASLMKDYQSSTTVGDMSASDEQQMVEQVIKTFSANHLSGVEIINHWIHPNGTMFSLAKLDLDGFQEMIDRHQQLSAAIRDRVRRSSERAFADLEREEARAAAE